MSRSSHNSTSTLLSQDRKGFTLLETIIAIALSASVLTTAAMLFHSTLSTEGRVRGHQRLADATFLVEQTMSDRITSANGISEPASGSSETLTISTTDNATNPTTFTVTNGALTIQEGSSASEPLTPNTVTVTDFTITRITGDPASITISTTMETQVGSETINSDASWTSTLRYAE